MGEWYTIRLAPRRGRAAALRARSPRRRSLLGRSAAAARAPAQPHWSAVSAFCSPRSPSCPLPATSRPWWFRLSPRARAAAPPRAPGAAHDTPPLGGWPRGGGRLVEYGSSWGAIRAAGARRSIMDTVFTLNAEHLGKGAVTVYESLEDAGRVAPAGDTTCYRGRTPHPGGGPGFT